MKTLKEEERKIENLAGWEGGGNFHTRERANAKPKKFKIRGKGGFYRQERGF